VRRGCDRASLHFASAFINTCEIILETLVGNDEFNLIYLALPIRGKGGL
jgi:hypothetical protein